MAPRSRHAAASPQPVPSVHCSPFNPIMDAGLEVRPLVVGYTWALCRAIASCTELLRVLRLLKQAANTLFQIDDGLDQPCAGTEAGDEDVTSCRRALLVAVAAAIGCVEYSMSGSIRSGDGTICHTTGSGNGGVMKSGVLVMRGGRVIIASVKEGSEEEEAKAIRQAMQGVRVGSVQLAVPVMASMGYSESITHPGARRSLTA